MGDRPVGDPSCLGVRCTVSALRQLRDGFKTGRARLLPSVSLPRLRLGRSLALPNDGFEGRSSLSVGWLVAERSEAPAHADWGVASLRRQPPQIFAVTKHKGKAAICRFKARVCFVAGSAQLTTAIGIVAEHLDCES
jgi:hypothetical protein